MYNFLIVYVDMFKILSVIIMPGHLKLEQQYYNLGSIKKQIENFIHVSFTLSDHTGIFLS